MKQKWEGLQWDCIPVSEYYDSISKVLSFAENRLEAINGERLVIADRRLLEDCCKAIDWLLEDNVALELELDNITEISERYGIGGGNEHQSS